MAKKTRAKRKEKKNIPNGVVHIQSTFNNTIITITDPAVMLWPGQAPASRDLRVLERAPRLPPNWQPKMLLKRQWNME
jgi:hypothetical protein